MDREKLIEAGIDYDAALKRFVGREDLYQKYLIQFLADDKFEKLKTAIIKRDAKEAFKQAHALKGVTGTLSISRLFTALEEVVTPLRIENIDEAEKNMEKVQKEYMCALSAIRSEVGVPS